MNLNILAHIEIINRKAKRNHIPEEEEIEAQEDESKKTDNEDNDSEAEEPSLNPFDADSDTG